MAKSAKTSGPPQYSTIDFPVAGLNKSLSYEFVAPYSCPASNNMRPVEVGTERRRGGTRPAITKATAQRDTLAWVNTGQIDTTHQPRLLTDIFWSDNTTPGSAVLKNYVLASADGALKRLIEGAAVTTLVWTAVTNSKADAARTLRSDIMLSAIDYHQALYIAGNSETTHNLLKYTPSSDTISKPTASAGSLPTNCRQVLRHNDRLWLMVDEVNPHMWYASAIGAELDFDYGANTLGQAISGTTSEAGQSGEPITCGVSHSNYCMLLACPDSLWMMRGDPATGGSISCLSKRIGIIDRFAYCHDAQMNCWFISRDGLYLIPAGCGSDNAPEQVSRSKLPQELVHINPATTWVSMAYDVQHQGIHIALTPTSDPSSAVTHWWYSINTQSFWPLTLTYARSPLAMMNRRGWTAQNASESNTWMACTDSFVRRYDEAASTDDASTAISGYVDFGPFPLGAPNYDGILSEVQLVNSSDTTGAVTLAVRVGAGAEAAYNASAIYTQTLSTAGLNYTWRPLSRGHACVMRLTATAPWGFEDMTMRRLPAGLRRVE